MSAWFRLSWAAWVLGTTAACQFSSTVPDPFKVQCERDADCPRTFVCQKTGSHLCVARENIDTEAPRIEPGASVSLVSERPLLVSPLAMGEGTVARVTFTASEPLTTASVEVCPDALTCTQLRRDNLTYVFSCRFNEAPPAPVETGCDVSAHLVDRGGNKASVALGLAVSLDTVAPGRPDVDTEDSVVFSRAPFGSEASAHNPELSVTVQGLGPDERVVAWGSGPLDEVPLAMGQPAAAKLVLPSDDRAQVWVSRVDAAGNESPRVRVRDVVYTGALGTVAGNPHRFDARAAHSAALVRTDARRVTAADGLAGIGAGVVTTAGTWVWQRRDYQRWPANTGVASAWFPSRARVVSFGGTQTSGVLEWNSQGWAVPVISDPEHDGQPVATHGAAMAFDVSTESMVLFGGLLNGAPLAETWRWHGSSWSRVQPSTSPAGRTDHRMVLDARRGRIVMFGGRLGSGAYTDETWEWNGEEWKQAEPTTRPPARSDFGMAYDPARKQVVVVGGEGAGGSPLGDAWGFDGTAWAPIPELTGAPLPRVGHGLAFDSRRNALVLAGGLTGDDAGASSDLWEASGTGWVKVANGNMGQPFARGIFAYDPARQVLVRAGGSTDDVTSIYRPDAGWTQAWVPTPPRLGSVPPPRVNHAMAFDENLQNVIIHGGEYGPYQFDETLRWDGTAFYKVNTPTSPGARTFHAMAFDRNLGGTVMTGGIGEPGFVAVPAPDGGAYSNVNGTPRTWLLKNGDWAPLPLVSPPARFIHTLYFDSLNSTLMAAGGSGVLPTPQGDLRLNGASGPLADVWGLLPSGVWKRFPDFPVFSVGPAGVFHEARKTHIILPGQTPFTPYNGVFEKLVASGIDDAGFTLVPPVDAPPQMQVQNLVYDTARERVIHYGPPFQTLSSLESDRLWEWTGARFSQITVSDAELFGTPGRQTAFRWTFDRARQRAVMFGGLTNNLWELDSATRRPSHVFTLSLKALGLSPQASVRALTVSAVAGADSVSRQSDGGWAGTPGVDVVPFVDGAFAQPVGSNTAGSSAPGKLQVALPEGMAARAIEGQTTFSVALMPHGVNGNRTATVATDYVEASVSYRLPAEP